MACSIPKIECCENRFLRQSRVCVNDLLNSLQLAHHEAEGQLPDEMLALVDQMVQQAAARLKSLGDLETVREKEMVIGLGIEYPDSAA